MLLCSLLLGIGAGCATDEGGGAGGLGITGTYDTVVSLVASSCPFTVQTNPTQVRTGGGSAIQLTHAGTTYAGIVDADSSFVTSEKVVTVGGTAYHITIAGDFTAQGLDAIVTVVFGNAPCTATVRWLGPKR